MDDVFDALGDSTRRQLLALLAAGEQPVTALVTTLRASGRPISQPAVSQHLKVLREARLVAARTEGTRRFYSVDEAGLAAARAWLTRLGDPLAPFAQPLDALETEIVRGRHARRAGRARRAAG